MPFSYIREPTPRSADAGQNDSRGQPAHSGQAHPPQQTHFQSQQGFPGYSTYPSAGMVMQDFAPASYSTRSRPLDMHCSTVSAGPSSSSSGSSSNGKQFASPSPSSAHPGGGGNEGIFQMPAFLMGGFGGTLAPGGGAEVLTPCTMGMLSSFSSPYGLLQSSLGSSSCSEKALSWQTPKCYTIEEQQHQDDVADGAASAPVTHTHSKSPPAPAAASPFGYLNADMSQEQKMDTTVQQESEAMDETSRPIARPTAGAVVPSDEHAPSSVPSMEVHPMDALRQFSPQGVYALMPSAGLPLYSQSGFDMLSILARVARRPNQTISLGPVDFSCSFIVADVRQPDAPVVYASPTFCELTGYSEGEILGQNCRFLQAPGGRVARSEIRRFTSSDAVRDMRFALDKDREVQVSLVNYRKDEQPFVNRVSIVPIPATDDGSEIAFHVGFQVDLNVQPGLITQRMQQGKFYSSDDPGDSLYKSLTPAERSARGLGRNLRALLSDPSFQSSVPLTVSCNSAQSSATATSSTTDPNTSASSSRSASKPDTRDERQWLHLLLLEHLPDFIHVLSLKGHFLYVSPGITRVLGYSPADLIGKSVGDFCHPSDAVPLLRELKESTGHTVVPSANESGDTASGEGHEARQTHMGQRTVDLLFRMRTKAGGYAWVESIGRLHVEAGKGRKAIVLSGRTCAMPNLRWGAISQAGGILGTSTSIIPHGSLSGGSAPEESSGEERELWAMLCEDGLFLVAGMASRELLGWGSAEMIGRSIRDFVVSDDAEPHSPSTYAFASAEQVLTAVKIAYAGESGTQKLSCRMRRRDGEMVSMDVTLYANESRTVSGRIIVQFKILPSPSLSAPASAYHSQLFSPTYHTSPYVHQFTSSHPHSHPSHPYPHTPYVHSHVPAHGHAHATFSSSTAGRISHAPTTNAFAEFETHRGTSWQYELQQLKYANDKLREEVGVLETRQRLRRQQQQQRQSHQGTWIENVQA
ncbi:uncharacterized protein FOMMEDRAFT_31982 [Fomitiporia mediterranea MF3/22]|uniref:uncharacterized protein n=1 Tax=Fomitiporia mediterranea (strain MF3/22) TaxID=694068 RepID=UPI0004408B7E|nr:uncharacterized protein FOMMEDRAFT_31982 [Fomitiporia mediterranea MF3/22]EJC98220.1 hypothetical protein FOMMEDRAFT_31982 [Fomitiporia mediterranea MF3/22]